MGMQFYSDGCDQEFHAIRIYAPAREAEVTEKAHPARNCLRDLEVWLVGSDELTRATSSVCRVASLAAGADWRAHLRDSRPDFLLVEGADSLSALWAAGLDDLLDICEEQGIPRFLWITASPFDPVFLRACPRFSRAFTVDCDHRQTPAAARAPDPSILWPGTSIPLPVAPPPAMGGQRPDSVVWLGAWHDAWPEAWRARLLSILEAACDRGLRIVGPGDPEALPARLRPHVDLTRSPDLESRLRRAKIVIGADAASAAPGFSPRIVFDAIACGAAVITPHTFATPFDFSLGKWGDGSWRSLIPVVEDRATAAAELDRLLSDDELFDDTVERCMRIVRLNHTHAHRIATLASAAGIRLVPDATQDPAHR